MNRIQKRFLEKLTRPVLITLTLIGAGGLAHVVSSIWGATLIHVLVVAVVYVVYIFGAALFVGFPLLVIAIQLQTKWQEAKEEVEHERQELMNTLRNDYRSNNL